MQAPTWKEIGIPENMVNTIREMNPSYAMDCLINQIVFHNHKKLILAYYCDDCGYQHVPQRSNEEVNHCNYCHNKRVRCVQSFKVNPEKKTPYFTRTGIFMLDIAYQMKQNFILYFKNYPEKDIDWEWHEGYYHVAFAGGETAISEVPRVAIASAALLTPYLWDSMYDWRNNCRHDTADQRFITNFLNHFSRQSKR